MRSTRVGSRSQSRSGAAEDRGAEEGVGGAWRVGGAWKRAWAGGERGVEAACFLSGVVLAPSFLGALAALFCTGETDG